MLHCPSRPRGQPGNLPGQTEIETLQAAICASTARPGRATPSFMTSPSSHRSEDELITRFFAPLAGEGGLALKDDAALLHPASGHDLVLTVDGIAAGVHFLPDDPPASIAHK